MKPVRSAPGILGMTWSFTSPDGRATFQLITVNGELHCRWRRVGDTTLSRTRRGRVLNGVSAFKPRPADIVQDDVFRLTETVTAVRSRRSYVEVGLRHGR